MTDIEKITAEADCLRERTFFLTAENERLKSEIDNFVDVCKQYSDTQRSLEYDLAAARKVISQLEAERLRDALDGQAALDEANNAVVAARKEAELWRMRLAACGVAAMSNTEKTIAQRIGNDNEYYSASYGDVCDAVDREMAARKVIEGVRGYLDEKAKGPSFPYFPHAVKDIMKLLGGTQ